MMSTATLGILILGGLALWFLGGFVLRLGGLLIFVAGGGVGGRERQRGILVALLGDLGWLASHWHYALCHQEYKSPLARHLFSRWPLTWLDPRGREVVAVTCSGSPHRFQSGNPKEEAMITAAADPDTMKLDEAD